VKRTRMLKAILSLAGGRADPSVGLTLASRRGGPASL
jgi:hypothetical protein